MQFWSGTSGELYQVPELMLEPHPPAPVPVMCGGESEAALRRAARLCDGSVGTAYVWDDAVPYLLDVPSTDLFERAEDLGVTAGMCAPWMGTAERESGRVGAFRGLIERFAENVIAKVR